MYSLYGVFILSVECNVLLVLILTVLLVWGAFWFFDGLTKSLLVCYIFLSFWASKQFALFIFLQFSFSIYLLWNTQVFYNYNQRKFAIVILQTTKSLLNWFSLFSPGWRGAHYVLQVCNTFKEICMLLSFKWWN